MPAAWIDFQDNGAQWYCNGPGPERGDVFECDGSNGGFEDDWGKIRTEAAAHKRQNPSHRVFIDRMATTEVKLQ